MATDDGADGFDPLPLPDDFDDVLPLLNMADFDIAEDQPSCSHSFSANGLPYWPGMVGNGNYSTRDGAPGVVAQPNGLPVHGGPSPSVSLTTAARQADVVDCSGCQLLREVVHSNGLELAKLRVHGAADLFCHATSEVYRINSEGLATALTHQSCIEGQDHEWVRHYLTNYALQRAAGNYTVVCDSLSAFHDVLCTTMNPGIQVNEHRHHEGAAARNGADRRRRHTVDNAAALIQPAIRKNKEPEPAGPSQPNLTTDVRVQQPLQRVNAGRSALALQKERTSKMQFHDIAPYFHLPIVKAAEKLDICSTVLKRICRRVGVQRWPHRKVKQLDSQISKLRKSGQDGAWARDEIERLNADRKTIFHGPK